MNQENKDKIPKHQINRYKDKIEIKSNLKDNAN